MLQQFDKCQICNKDLNSIRDPVWRGLCMDCYLAEERKRIANNKPNDPLNAGFKVYEMMQKEN